MITVRHALFMHHIVPLYYCIAVHIYSEVVILKILFLHKNQKSLITKYYLKISKSWTSLLYKLFN